MERRAGIVVTLGAVLCAGAACNDLVVIREPTDFEVDASGEASSNNLGEGSPVEEGPDDASPGDGFPVDVTRVGDAGCDIAGCPLTVQPSHLMLWLRADQGVTCAIGDDSRQRVTLWADQSGQNRHATLTPGQLGPYCGETAPRWGACRSRTSPRRRPISRTTR
jgi:hypothetical protein